MSPLIFSLFLVIITLMKDTLAFPQQSDRSNEDESYPVDGFVFDGPADRLPVRSTTERRSPTFTSTTERTTTTTSTKSFDDCVNSCPVTPEYNPVCGTDNVSYNNPGRLSCATLCGKAVTLNYYGRCAAGQTRG